MFKMLVSLFFNSLDQLFFVVYLFRVNFKLWLFLLYVDLQLLILSF